MNKKIINLFLLFTFSIQASTAQRLSQAAKNIAGRIKYSIPTWKETAKNAYNQGKSWGRTQIKPISSFVALSATVANIDSAISYEVKKPQLVEFNPENIDAYPEKKIIIFSICSRSSCN